MEHLVNDLLHCRLQAWTFPADIRRPAGWARASCSCCRPRRGVRRRSSSAGVHGNETAPTELLLQLTTI